MQQHLTRAVREALFVTLREDRPRQHFAIGGADGADARIQRIGDVKSFTVRRDIHAEVFQIRMGRSDRF